MKLDEFKEDIYKCSGCGLCQGVCPIYKAIKTECAVSRGKFKLLNAILNKDTSFSKKTLEYMELCLHCNKCTNFCPSGINAQKIIETAKSDMLSVGLYNPLKILLAKTLCNKIIMTLAKISINIIRKLKLLELIDIFNCPQNKLARNFIKIKVKQQRTCNQPQKTNKILYFKGCINNYINPSCANAVSNILQNTQIEIIEADFNCCGLPAKSAGDFKTFIKTAKENLKKAISKEFDYLIFDCASCKSTFLEYADFLTGKEKEEALLLNTKILSIYELLDKLNYKPQTPLEKITAHYPCHINKKEKEILQKFLHNLNFIECENADNCCGAAGSFIFSNNEISKEISAQKAKSIIKSDANIVVTTCPSCILGLNQGLISQKSDIEVLHLIELLGK